MAHEIELTVPDSLDGERLDKVVAAMLDLSRARSAALVERGANVDGHPARAADRVRSGQSIVCPEPEMTLRMVPEDVRFGVLHEDESVIVVNKPPGLVVHPGSGRSKGTLAAGLVYRYPELVGVGAEERWGLVHRLDKDTSGALLVGRTQAAFEALVEELRRRKVARVYTTLVEGTMGAPTGTVEAPIGRDPNRATRRAITPTGKHARTHYEVIRDFPDSEVTLLDVRLETGRTHQIRVHMAAIGHPVVGDRTYGASRRDIAAPRTFLHASSVGFTHPDSGERMTVEAPLPADLSAVLEPLT